MKCPESIEELEELEKLIPLCRKSLYEQRQARKKKDPDKSDRQISKELAEEIGCSPETVRTAIKREDSACKVGSLNPPSKFAAREPKPNEGIQDIIKQVCVQPEASGAARCHVKHNSGENEWYTPPEYIEAVKAVMGTIDLDPASSDKANCIVEASTYFTKEEDALKKMWFGRIFLNPPYSQPLIKQFSDKLCSSINNSEIKEAIVLVNNATDTTWFQNMAQRASAICFTNKRIRFLDPEGNLGAPLQGQAVLYWGHDIEKFRLIFHYFGFVMQHV